MKDYIQQPIASLANMEVKGRKVGRRNRKTTVLIFRNDKMARLYTRRRAHGYVKEIFREKLNLFE